MTTYDDGVLTTGLESAPISIPGNGLITNAKPGGLVGRAEVEAEGESLPGGCSPSPPDHKAHVDVAAQVTVENESRLHGILPS
jgi:hypothetical protein